MKWSFWKIRNDICSVIDANNYDLPVPLIKPRYQFSDREVIFPNDTIDSELPEGNFQRVFDFLSRSDYKGRIRIILNVRLLTYKKPGIGQRIYVWADDKEIIDAVREIF